MGAARNYMLTATAMSAIIAVAACSGGSTASTTATDAGPTTATVESAPATTAPVATTEAVPEIDWTGIDDAATLGIEANSLNGAALVLVDADRGVVGERYWGDFSADRVSLIASSSKMITATVIMGLATDGVIDLDAPIADQVSWTGGNPTITFADLLSSQSGLVGLAPNPAYPPYVCQFLTAGTLAECAQQVDTTPDDDTDTVPPRTEFRYGGAQWQVAGGAASDIAGKPWAELVNEYLVAPCGLDSLGYTNHWAEFASGFDYPSARFNGDVATLPVTDNPSMEGGVYIDPIDYAAMLLMHLNGGRCGDTQVVDPALIERAHTDQNADEFGHYGFGWAIEYDGTIKDPGAFGSVAWLDLGNNTGAWFVVEATSTAGNAVWDQLLPPVKAELAKF